MKGLNVSLLVGIGLGGALLVAYGLRPGRAIEWEHALAYWAESLDDSPLEKGGPVDGFESRVMLGRDRHRVLPIPLVAPGLSVYLGEGHETESISVFARSPIPLRVEVSVDESSLGVINLDREYAWHTLDVSKRTFSTWRLGYPSGTLGPSWGGLDRHLRQAKAPVRMGARLWSGDRGHLIFGENTIAVQAESIVICWFSIQGESSMRSFSAGDWESAKAHLESDPEPSFCLIAYLPPVQSSDETQQWSIPLDRFGLPSIVSDGKPMVGLGALGLPAGWGCCDQELPARIRLRKGAPLFRPAAWVSKMRLR